MNKALYIGAGTDLKTIKNLPHIKSFIYIDSQPHNENENEIQKHSYQNFNSLFSWFYPKINGFCKSNLLFDLKDIAKKEDIVLTEETSNKLIFTYNDQTITYFINTKVPDHLENIKENITDFDNLIVIGHDPDSKILEYTKNKINFWGNISTVYKNEYYDKLAKVNEETNKICYRLNYEQNFQEKFHKFNLIELNGYNRKFIYWDNFVNFISKTKKSNIK